MNSRKNLLMVTAAALLLTGVGCSSLKRSENSYSARENGDAAVEKDPKIQNLESTVATLNTRIQELEGKLQASENRPRYSDTLIRQASDAIQNLKPNASPIRASIAEGDPESGFANDQNTRAFQQGKILFDQEKYPEAILALSAFLERNGNHTLASHAQYYIAESYYMEGDFAVADQEFQRLVLKYPRSPRASHAFVRLSLCSEKLGKTEEAKRYRLQAEALYPRSPALKGLRETSTTTGVRVLPAPIQEAALVVPPTAPEVESPRVETPHVEAPHVEAPRVEAPKIQTLQTTGSGSDLDSPPGMGDGG